MGESLAEVLRLFRSTAHLSQEALAERSGLSTRTVSDIETGSARTPRLVTVMLLAEAMNLSPPDRLRLQDAARKPAGSVDRPTSTIAAPALIGRDADCGRLMALLDRDEARVVTLVGPAGVGKTSLALRVAADRAGSYPCGAIVAELASLDDPSLVPAQVARALAIRLSPDTPAAEAVRAYLRDRRMLLVLDNLEHLATAAAWIASLIAGCTNLTILTTSREPLRLQRERVYPVRPLETSAAAALFVQRAQMLNPDFEVGASDASAIDTIVGHLEGLPLAIELAAPRLAMLAPKALAARLERRLPLLGDGSVDRPRRQQTMHDAIAWSYDLLTESERQLFRRLGVLHGGGDFEAAAAVADFRNDQRPILFRLGPLVDKNMLTLQADREAEPRVGMLEMLREFALEKLLEAGESADTSSRHAHYVVQFAERSERQLTGADQGRWLARFEMEHANIRAALQWTSRNDEAALGFRLIAAVWRFWWLQGHFVEGLEWLRRFLHLRSDLSALVPGALRAKVLRAHVVLLSALGNFEEALVSCEQAICLQRAAHDDAGLAASLTSLGIIMQYSGEYDAGERAHTESLKIRTRLGDDAGVATSLSNLSSIAFSKDDLPAAASFAERSIALYRRLGHESGLAHALSKIGLVAAAQRDYDRAEEMFNECLRVQQSVGNTGSLYYTLENLATVAHHRGNYGLALTRFQEVLDLLDSMPNKSALAKTLEDFAATIAAVGDPARAARTLAAADALRAAIGSPIFPSERANYDAVVDGVRATLGEAAFGVQWQLGASVTLERALEEARAVTPQRAP